MNTVRGKYVLSTLSRRVDNRRLPAIRVVDMRAEAQQSGRIGVLSKELMSAIQERLGGAEQTILFLNRRGFSSSLLCVKCGHRSDCDFCSVACTYHRQDDSLRCHICGRVNPAPRRCPACGDPQFKFAGIGTQRVERIVQKCFPHARVQRLDSDVTGRKDAYERILGDFRAGRTDILIGTQMIAKGLHLPNVTLVGVIYADLSLHVPDFRAGERTFQLLAQVAGRAGRGEMPGEVIIQTFTPHHPAVQAARRTDYLGFSDQELAFRRELKYPPFSHMICITLAGVAEEKVAFAAKVFSKELAKQMDKGVLISPPTPAPIARAKGRYRYQIFLRAGSTLKMTRPLKIMVQKLKLPPGVKCSVDVDVLSML
jgi:primosomal protein N' (replication factor Y)